MGKATVTSTARKAGRTGQVDRDGERVNVANISRLPAPLVANWDWQQHGACRDSGDGLFFAPVGERPSTRARREAAAKAICARCSVRDECLDWALTVQEPYGIWGGTNPEERTAILAAHRRDEAS